MTAFRKAMTGLYLATIGMDAADAAHFLRLAAQLEAFEFHLKGSR